MYGLKQVVERCEQRCYGSLWRQLAGIRVAVDRREMGEADAVFEHDPLCCCDVRCGEQGRAEVMAAHDTPSSRWFLHLLRLYRHQRRYRASSSVRLMHCLLRLLLRFLLLVLLLLRLPVCRFLSLSRLLSALPHAPQHLWLPLL
jgi:hypothetical protein